MKWNFNIMKKNLNKIFFKINVCNRKHYTYLTFIKTFLIRDNEFPFS